MELRDGGNLLLVTCNFVGKTYSSRRADRQIPVSVLSDGFAGDMSVVWVDATAFEQFLAQLAALEARRQGTARLKGMDNPDFWLEFRSTDGIGHMSVSGRVARDGQMLEFEFPFCPSLLQNVVVEFTAIAEAVA